MQTTSRATKRTWCFFAVNSNSAFFALVSVRAQFAQVLPLMQTSSEAIKWNWCFFTLNQRTTFFTLVILHYFIPNLCRAQLLLPYSSYCGISVFMKEAWNCMLHVLMYWP